MTAYNKAITAAIAAATEQPSSEGIQFAILFFFFFFLIPAMKALSPGAYGGCPARSAFYPGSRGLTDGGLQSG